MKRPIYTNINGNLGRLMSHHAITYTQEAKATALENLSSYRDKQDTRDFLLGMALFILVILLFVCFA